MKTLMRKSILIVVLLIAILGLCYQIILDEISARLATEDENGLDGAAALKVAGIME